MESIIKELSLTHIFLIVFDLGILLSSTILFLFNEKKIVPHLRTAYLGPDGILSKAELVSFVCTIFLPIYLLTYLNLWILGVPWHNQAGQFFYGLLLGCLTNKGADLLDKYGGKILGKENKEE